MDPTGAALIFGGVVSLFLGVVREVIPPAWGNRWPCLRPRWHNQVPARWCYWLGLGLIVAGIVW